MRDRNRWRSIVLQALRFEFASEPVSAEARQFGAQILLGFATEARRSLSGEGAANDTVKPLREVIDVLDETCSSEFIAARTELDRISACARLSECDEILLRSLLAQTIRDLADRGASESLERVVRAGIGLGISDRLAADNVMAELQSETRSAPIEPEFSPRALTEYLRARLPEESSIQVTAVEPLSSGYSKRILSVRLVQTSKLPQEVVVRQDTIRMEGESVVAEYRVMAALAASGIPIPQLLHVEENPTSLGAPFMLMSRLKGEPLGGWFGTSAVKRSVFEDIARILATLHRFPVADSGYGNRSSEGSAQERMARQIAHYWDRYRSAALEPSVLVDCGYALIQRLCRADLGAPCVVHGDLSTHNFLIHAERISALLDWEYAHIGVAAEDLAYCKPSIEAVLPWPRFIDMYVAAGGNRIDEYWITVFELWSALRNAALAAGAAQSYLRHGTALPFRFGAVGYLSAPVVERQIAICLQRLSKSGAPFGEMPLGSAE